MFQTTDILQLGRRISSAHHYLGVMRSRGCRDRVTEDGGASAGRPMWLLVIVDRSSGDLGTL